MAPTKREGELARDIYIQMGIVRLKKYQCDVMLTLNTELGTLNSHPVQESPSLYLSADEGSV